MSVTIYECPNGCKISPVPGLCMQCDTVLVSTEYVPASEIAYLQKRVNSEHDLNCDLVSELIDLAQLVGLNDSTPDMQRETVKAITRLQTRLTDATALIDILSHAGHIQPEMMTDAGAAWDKWMGRATFQPGQAVIVDGKTRGVIEERCGHFYRVRFPGKRNVGLFMPGSLELTK